MINPWSGLKGLPKGVWTLFTTVLINRAGTMVLPFLVLYLTKGLGFSAWRASLVITLYGIGALVAGPLSGRLCDWVGPDRVMKMSLLGSGAILFLYPLTNNFALILAITIVWSVISESFRPASLAITADLVEPDRRKAAFALVRLAINLGMSIGPVLGGFLAMVSFSSLFLIDGLTSIFAGIFLVLFTSQAKKIGSPEHVNDGKSSAGIQLPGLFSDWRLFYFLAAFIPVMIVFFQHISSLPLFLVRNVGLPESIYGFLFSINTLVIIFLEVPLNMAMADWPHRRALALGAMLCGVGFGALAFAGNTLVVVITIVIWTFGEMVLFPAAAAYMADIAPVERRGEYMGFYTMASSLAYICSSIGPVVLERLGADLLWGGAFAFCIVSAVMMGRVHTKEYCLQPSEG